MAIALTTYKGKKFSRDFADALREADRLLPTIPVRITQGGFGNSVAASAGTHGGDAVDISVRGLSQAQVTQIILTLRTVGIAAFFRTTKRAKWGTRAHGFSSYHIHGVPNGWGYPSKSARYQALGRGGYRAGRDGLASAGYDRGPGHTGAYRNRTWHDYKRSNLKPGLPSTGNSTSSAKPAAPKPVFPRVYPTVASTRVAEDGVLGPQTIKRLQMTLQVLPDGKLGHFTVRALKMWLGNKDDGSGILSPTNVSQLQHRVGAYKDGKWGTGTTKALQKYLNRNPVKP